MQAPVISHLPDGRVSASWKNPDGSTTNLIGANVEEVLTKASIAYQNAVDALARSRQQQVENGRAAAEAIAQAKADSIINQFLRNAAAEFNGSFYVCEANNNLILGWLQARQLPTTVSNLNMALADLMEKNALAQPPKADEPIEQLAPLTEVPVQGHPGNSVSTIKQLRAMTNLRALVDPRLYRPEIISAWKQRMAEIIARGN